MTWQWVAIWLGTLGLTVALFVGVLWVQGRNEALKIRARRRTIFERPADEQLTLDEIDELPLVGEERE